MSTLAPRLHHAALAGLSAFTLVAASITPIASAQAASPGRSLHALASVAGEGTVLDLEGDDEAKAAALTRALRGQFAARGVGGGKEMSAIELKLTMGCEDPPAPECMASGGKTLGVKQMVYGTLKTAGAGFAVDLVLLDVDGGAVKKNVQTQLSAEALEAGQIDATAKDLVEQMIGPAPVETTPVEATPVGGGETEGPDEEPARSGSRLVWGRHKAAGWKKGGLIASAALTGVSLGAAIATSLMIRKNGPIYNDLIAAAQASLDDNKSSNDINPNTDLDLCNQALDVPNPDKPNEVRNASVATVCNRGKTVATVATASWVATGVFAASTVAFTVLLFVHKEETGVSARLRRRGVTMGVAPITGGGAMVGGGWRF